MALPWAVRPASEPVVVEPLARPLWPGVAAFLSLAVPLFVTALRVSVAPEWRDDVAIVRSLGLVPVDGEGVPSAVLAELAALLPIGGRVLRAGLVGALGAGLCGRGVYGLSLAFLERNGATPRLSPTLALAAALMAVLTPSFQAESTVASGAALSAGLALLVLLAREHGAPGDARRAFGIGALLGLAFAESRIVAAAAALSLGASVLARLRLPPVRVVLLGAAGFAASAGFCALPLLVRPLSDHAAMTLGLDLGPRGALATDLVIGSGSPLLAFLRELGPLALGLGAAGALWAVLRPALRAGVAELGVLVVFAALVATRGPSVLAASPVAGLTLLGIAALAVLAVLGVQTSSLALARARIPLAAPASVLLVVFHFTLVFAAAESSGARVTETRGLGAEVWTDEALGELPMGSLLIVRSRTLAFRLWSARVARGERPDLVVVPLALLGRGDVARRLIDQEPALAPLMRDVAMTGRTSEYALSSLADVRPVYVELDPEWDGRLLDHLRPTPLWLEFAAHTLGRSDRGLATADESGRRAFRRVLAAAKRERSGEGDTGTLAVLAASARDHAVVLAALGDRDSALRVLGDLERIEPGSSFARTVRASLADKHRPALTALLDRPAR